MLRLSEIMAEKAMFGSFKKSNVCYRLRISFWPGNRSLLYLYMVAVHFGNIKIACFEPVGKPLRRTTSNREVGILDQIRKKTAITHVWSIIP